MSESKVIFSSVATPKVKLLRSTHVPKAYKPMCSEIKSTQLKINFTMIVKLPFHQEGDGSVESAPLYVPGAVDVQPELREQLEVKRHSI